MVQCTSFPTPTTCTHNPTQLGDKRPKLFYNDYNVASATGWSKHKSDLMYNMTKGMLARGIPIDGVGLQMHLKSGYSADMVEGIRENMKRLGALGLEVHVTELDISIDGDATDKALEEQVSGYLSRSYSHITE